MKPNKYTHTIELTLIAKTSMSAVHQTQRLLFVEEGDALSAFQTLNAWSNDNAAPKKVEVRDALGTLAFDLRDVLSVRLVDFAGLATYCAEEGARQGMIDAMRKLAEDETKATTGSLAT